jgi:3-deoxy-7-phosphoheptulonate synthase
MNAQAKLQDRRVQRYVELPRPSDAIIPLTGNTTFDTRQALHNILQGEDHRLAVFVGPCSIHSEDSAMEFTERLKHLQEEVPNLLLIMRFFIQKPRTTVGWTGFLEDPDMDGRYDIAMGLQRSINLAYDIVEKVGQPICMELLGTTIEPQYFNNYLSAGFIGARTSESQIHRNLASGVSFPIGIKNPSDGSADVALQGVIAARVPRSFCGVNTEGKICAVHTLGNHDAFVVLRGSYKNGPNIKEGLARLRNEKVGIVVDCAHGNSDRDLNKQYANALFASKHSRVCGIMLESHLKHGKQSASPDAAYDISVTDPCLGWDETEKLLRSIDVNRKGERKVRYE